MRKKIFLALAVPQTIVFLKFDVSSVIRIVIIRFFTHVNLLESPFHIIHYECSNKVRLIQQHTPIDAQVNKKKNYIPINKLRNSRKKKRRK